MSITIRRERPDTQVATSLIEELEAILSPLYPNESRHGYSIAKLIEQQVEFFVLRVDDEPVGCAGVQIFVGLDGTSYGEVKRMYVRDAFRGLGLAKQLLKHLEEITAAHQIAILRLETGIHQTAAIGLYEQQGFQRIGPFGDYRADPNSLYFEKQLQADHNSPKTRHE